jgi:drug/metabolite transporter (DMT)-like permease
MKLPLPRGRALLGAILFGALNFGGSYAFMYYGLEKVQPGMSMVILALVPLFTLIFAIAHRQETFRWRAMLGALVAVGGIALVFRQQLRTAVPFLSLLAVILGAVCIAEAGVIAKDFPRSHPITTNAIGMSVGAIILFLMSILWHENLVMPVRTATWIALIYLILFGTCAVFILILYILKRWPASTISYQFVLMPFVTLTASAWLTHETLNPILLVGAALVLMGVFIGVRSSPKRKAVGGIPAGNMDEAMSRIIK